MPLDGFRVGGSGRISSESTSPSVGQNAAQQNKTSKEPAVLTAVVHARRQAESGVEVCHHGVRGVVQAAAIAIEPEPHAAGLDPLPDVDIVYACAQLQRRTVTGTAETEGQMRR